MACKDQLFYFGEIIDGEIPDVEFSTEDTVMSIKNKIHKELGELLFLPAHSI